MKRFIQLICIAAMAICTHSCASTIQAEETVVKLESHMNQSHKSSDLFSEEDLLVLKNPSDSSLVSSVDRVAIMDDRVFVLDQKKNQILAFDSNGEFVASTARLIGKGKNEYIRLQNMAVDQSEKQIYLYCDAPYQMLVLDYDLHIVRRLDVDYLAREICMDSTCLYTLCHNIEKENEYELRCYDKTDLNGMYRLLVLYDKCIPGIFASGKSICSDGSRCFCSMPFDNRIYEVCDGKIDNVYVIDFGNKWFDYSSSKGVGGTAFINQNREKNWLIQNISFSNAFIVFNTNKSRSFFVNLRDNTGAMYRTQVNDLFPFSCSTYTPCQSENKGFAALTIPDEHSQAILDDIRDKSCPEISDKWDTISSKNGCNPMILKLK